MKALLLLSVLLSTALSLLALEVPFSSVPVKTDANLLKDYVRVDPDDKLPETLLTKTWLWQDDDALVLHFESMIDSTFSTGAISPRDQVPDADFVRVQLITIPDAYYAYYYVAFPTGTLVDGVRNSNMNATYDWNSHYSYVSEFNDSLWTVTMRIPLSELRFKQSVPYKWKIILTRYGKEAEDFYSKPYASTKMGNDYFLKAQDIELSHPVKRKLDLTFRPYFVKSYDLITKTGSYDPEHIGIDVAFTPGQRTRIKLSMNPDYSDVPPDNAQDNYNSKYPPYFSENRFFFTEDLDVFGNVSELLYTRNIVQPKLAFKLTGNSKVLNYGVLGAFDKEIKDGNYIINPDDYFQVLTVSPAWRTLKLTGSTISRMNEGYYSHVGVGSLKWEFIPKLAFQTAFTASLRKNENEGDSTATFGYTQNYTLSANPGDLDLSLSYVRISPDFTADAGWYLTTDQDNINYNVSWYKDNDEKFVDNYGMSFWGSQGREYISTNPISSHSLGGNVWFSFRQDYTISLSAGENTQLGLINDKHDTYYSSFNYNYDICDELGFNIGVGKNLSLVYELYDTRDLLTGSLSLWGTISKKLTYKLSGNVNDYDYPKVNFVNGETVLLDNRYAIINASLKYTPGQKLQFKGGLGLSTYESGGIYSNLSYFGNLRFEFLPEYFLYAGFKSNQSQDAPFETDDLLGHFRKDGASAYVKVAVTL